MNHISPKFTQSALHLGALFVFSFILLLWLSPDSYLMQICGTRYDASWFFTCGKAWMEGMTPYIDFADSKGPLLWLIYGIGYLLSPTSYHGVFWLSVVAYTITFHFIWLIARLFLDRKESALVLSVMPFFLFFITYHNEVRAEDFCMPSICGGILLTCRMLCSSDSIGGGYRSSAFWLGFCMACALLIKWNIFFMMGGMAIAVTIISFRQHKASVIIFGLLGMGLAVLPFVIDFLIAGNFTAFIQEYFINTFGITEDTYWNCFYRDKIVITVLYILLAIFCHRMHMSYWLLFAFLPIYMFLLSRAVFLHYYATAMPFFIFPAIYATKALSSHLCRIRCWVYVAILAIICIADIRFNIHPVFLATPTDSEGVRIAVMHRIAKTDKPKIMYTDGDGGQGLLACALPACKYWAQQKKASIEMRTAREKAVKERCADYILVTNLPETPANFIPLVIKSGYRQCYGPVKENGKTKIKALPLYEKQ